VSGATTAASFRRALSVKTEDFVAVIVNREFITRTGLLGHT
jgi:hypothetical protein